MQVLEAKANFYAQYAKCMKMKAKLMKKYQPAKKRINTNSARSFLKKGEYKDMTKEEWYEYLKQYNGIEYDGPI